MGAAECKSAGTQGCYWDHPQAQPLSPDGCWQPACMGLGAKKALSAIVLGTSRLSWGHCHTSKNGRPFWVLHLGCSVHPLGALRRIQMGRLIPLQSPWLVLDTHLLDCQSCSLLHRAPPSLPSPQWQLTPTSMALV